MVGLGVARVLGGIGTFSAASERLSSDWVVASWCVALLLTLVGWWMSAWMILRGQAEIAFSTLSIWIVATAFLYLAAYVLIPGTAIWSADGPRSGLRPVRSPFYLYLAAHFGVVLLHGIARSILLVTDAGPSTEPNPSLVPSAIMTGLSAAGAVLNGERNRALHLVAWLAVLVFVIRQSALTIG